MKISRVNEMRVADARAIEQFSISQELLMENAGLAAFTVLNQEVQITDKKFVLFCGGGNNGGDGLVVARKLHSNGAKVTVFLLGNPDKYSGAALLNYQIAQKLNLNMHRLETVETAKNEINNCDGIVDAIFGTGLARNVEGFYKKIIELINSSGKYVMSLDIPSGINGNSGQIMGTAVQANLTVTFGLAKTGNLLFPGFENGGKLFVTHISFPPEISNNSALKIEVNTPSVLPVRKQNTHKGSAGKALFISGANNYLGAPYFAAQSYLKCGGGLAYLAAPEKVVHSVAASGREIVFLPLAETNEGSTAYSSKTDILKAADLCDFVVIGPGLSLNEETQKLAQELIEEIKKPILIDGDAITAIANNTQLISQRKANTVLTPHIGEMSRICDKSINEIEADRISVLQETCKKLNAYIVLKGAHSQIGCPDGSVFINLSGNEGMATAGSGDVLTGTIAAMLGNGLDFENAVRTGVFMHGFAGDLANKVTGVDGLLAGDILHHLPQAMHTYRENPEAVFANNYQKIFLI